MIHTTHNSLISILTFLFICIGASGQEYSKNENGYGIKEKIEIEADGIKLLELKNQHGNITIEGWDKENIEIHTLINVNSPGPNGAEEVLDFISIQRAQLGEKLIFRTQFDEEFFSNYPFNIEYHIKLPSRLNLKIKNKLGDIIIQNILGQIILDQSYGRLHLLQSNNLIQHELKLNFIEALVEKTNAVNGTFSNCTFSADSLIQLDAESEYSMLTIENSARADIKSFTDRIQLNNCDSATVQGKQLIAQCTNLNSYGHFEINNGLLNIDLKESIKQLTVSNQNVNTSIKVPGSLSYHLNGEVTSGNFSHPNASLLRLIKEYDKLSFSGKIGSDEIVTSEFILFNEHSDLNIQNK
ncbi:hypothetical protein [Carboxylicivirga sp. N1Y90]|uniref:hypothetical protein n=1 Tax=Carboxylicivirga fragile TaxID=3417571 RepID=UPI003D344C77|nr:hypothetical protein [Marinilabiliaceae bacterium N1Y90]